MAMTAGSRPRARRMRDVLTVLTRSDLQVRYGRGRLRFLKWVLDPIAALGIYLLLVAFVLDQGTLATGLSLACAIVPFQLLLSSIVNAISAVQLRSSIILNMRFPRLLIPVSSVLTESVAFVATLLLLPAMMLAYGIAPTTAILWLPLCLAAGARVRLPGDPGRRLVPGAAAVRGLGRARGVLPRPGPGRARPRRRADP